MPWFLAGMMVPWFAAYFLVAYGDREAPGGAVTFFLRASLATGISLGLSSVAYFLGLFCLSPLGRRYCLLELAGFTAAAACFGLLAARAGAKSALPVPGAKCGNCRMGFSPSMARFFARRAKAHPTATPRTGRAAKPRERRPGAAEPPQKLLVGVFLAALAFAVVGVVAKCWESPLGDWDAWAIWNLRARCLFRAGPMWRQAFSPLFQHTDYPLLVPATSARCWLYLGSEATWVPWLVGALLTFSTVGMLAAGVARLRGSSQGLLAGLVLLGTVSFLQRGAWQYADVPLAFFVLAAVLLLTLYDATDRRRRALLFLSGLAAGLAAWTKNEGSLVLIAVAATHTVMAWRHRAAGSMLRELLAWTAGTLPGLAAVVLLKMCLNGNNDLVGGQGWNVSLARLTDVSRYGVVALALAGQALRVVKSFAVVLPLCWLLLGKAGRHGRGMTKYPAALGVLALVLTGYFLVYVMTPHDLAWHLRSSAERLLLHLWPLAIWTLFLYLATPQECSS
ncbi:MAG: glycosyltransferase family 39 protein [Thermoguttaceae bacterium]